MNRILATGLLSLAFTGGAALAANHPPSRSALSPAASNASLSNVSSVEDGCGGVRYNANLSFFGSVNDGGGSDLVWFTIYDDMQEKFAQSFTAPVGQSRTVSIAVEYPGGVGTVAPGIAVLVGETRGAGDLIEIDPYFPTRQTGCTIGGTPPSLSFSPTTGSVITYVSGAASPIAVGNAGGGTGSGPVATTTLTNCTISGGVAFPTTSFNPNISAVAGGAPSPATLHLPACVPQTATASASLQCLETRGSGNTPAQRSWTLSCPPTVVIAPPVIAQPALISAALGGGVPNAASQRPRVSNNALRLAFTSAASDLVGGDTNGRADIFLRDRLTASTTRISSVAEALNPGVAEAYDDPALSADGSRIAFTGSSGQVYAAVNGLGRRISASATGALGNGPSGKAVVPGSGSLVFFESAATNLLSGSDGNGVTKDIYVKDLGTEAVTLISRGPNGEPADGPSSAPFASADGQTIVFSTLALNIVPAAVSPVFSQNFDGVTAPNLPTGWSASNPIVGNGARWATGTVASPAPFSLPNAAIVDDQGSPSDKVLDSPAVTVSAIPASLSFRRYTNVEPGFDGLVLEISVNGGAFVDAMTAGGNFSAGGYDGTISVNFGSAIGGRPAWTSASNSYVLTTYNLPANVPTGSSVRLRWRMVTDASIGSIGARIDNVVATNLVVPASTQALFPAGVKAGTVQQATMMRGGGFGQSRFYLSRNRSSGELGNGDSINVKVTPDGRYGVFESLASNLISGDTNAVSDIYRFEISNNQVISLTRVSESKTGVQGNGASRDPTITDDGQTVMFETEATNLFAPDTNGNADVVLKSVASGDVVRASLGSGGSETNGTSVQSHISGDGSLLAFCTTASNIAANDNNGASDVVSASISSAAPRDEPAFITTALPLPNPAFPSCPGGYFVAAIDDGPGPGLSPGIFGLDLTLNAPGTLRLEGGLNFGGSLDGSQVAFAGFNIQNTANEPQRLTLVLNGNPSSSQSATLPVRITLIRQPSAGVNETVYQSTATLSLATAFTHTLTIQPGFHVVTVAPDGAASVPGGAADGQVYVSLASQFVDRPGGGFFGGVVVGGYHAAPPFGDNSGFASFCLGTGHSATARVLSAPSYGATGARDLRLRLLDHLNRVVLSSPQP